MKWPGCTAVMRDSPVSPRYRVTAHSAIVVIWQGRAPAKRFGPAWRVLAMPGRLLATHGCARRRVASLSKVGEFALHFSAKPASQPDQFLHFWSGLVPNWAHSRRPIFSFSVASGVRGFYVFPDIHVADFLVFGDIQCVPICHFGTHQVCTNSVFWCTFTAYGDNTSAKLRWRFLTSGTYPTFRVSWFRNSHEKHRRKKPRSLPGLVG